MKNNTIYGCADDLILFIVYAYNITSTHGFARMLNWRPKVQGRHQGGGYGGDCANEDVWSPTQTDGGEGKRPLSKTQLVIRKQILTILNMRHALI